MPKHEIVLEYKHSHLNRPQLQQIIGAALQSRTEVDEIIVRCPSAARTTHRVIEEIAANGHLRNSKGKKVRVTLALHYARGRR
jgi:predicted transcriptional regulator